MPEKKEMKNRLLFIFLLLLVIGIGLLHFFTPAHLFFYHDTYRRLSYFPITLGAIWFGVSGGVILAAITSIAFIPHLLLFWAQGPAAYYSELTEIIFYLSAGTVVGLISSREAKLRDQYKRLSEKLKRSYNRLHDQAQQLIDAQEQLEHSQQLSLLGNLSAALAHEIKNPLASIRGTSEILLDDFPENHPKHEFIQIMLTEISRLNTAVEEVLQYSRGQKDSKEAAPEPTSDVIKRVTSLLERQLKEKDITLSVKDETEAGHCRTDGAKLSHVMMNLLLNAIDAVPAGGRITIEQFDNDNGCTLTVCDTGPGIPEPYREKIFQPFITDKDSGTGLGLYISSKIIAGLGGTLSVSSPPSGGACFTILLPAFKA